MGWWAVTKVYAKCCQNSGSRAIHSTWGRRGQVGRDHEKTQHTMEALKTREEIIQ